MWAAVIMLSHVSIAQAELVANNIRSRDGLFYAYHRGKLVGQLADVATHLSQGVNQGVIDTVYRLEEVDRNRHDLPIVYVWLGDRLVQEFLIRQNHAFVMNDKTYEHTRNLLNVESDNLLEIRQEDAGDYMNHYARVCGRVHEVVIRKTATYINFAEDWKSDFTIYIPKEVFRKMDQEMLAGLSEKEVCVRGFVHSYYGPRITLLNPDMLEMVDERTE